MTKAVLAAVRKNGTVLLRDAAGLAGCASVAYGLWLAWHPLGFIAGGGFALAGALFSARGQ